LGYADAQAFGFAAIFGMIQDLKLYHIPVINGVARVDLLDTERYSLAAAMPQLGSLVVSRILNPNKSWFLTLGFNSSP
jgi:hypothetical protein